MKIQLFNADCLAQLPKIKEKVDLVVVDLPYAQTACAWDSLIDMKQMWIELKKICKRDCVYVFFCTTKFGYKLIQSNEKWFRYDLVWEKSRKVGFLSANKMPLRKHEMMYIFKEKGGTYNPQKTEGKPYKAPKMIYDGKMYNNGKPYNQTEINNKGDRHPTSILQFPEAPEEQEPREHEMMYVFKEKGGTYNPQKTEGKPYTIEKGHIKDGHVYGKKKRSGINNKGDRHPTTIVAFNNPKKSLHRTQKPVDLCEWLIKSYSNEGDLVLDFTMGSGTTGIACLNTGRRFIGIEKDADIFKLARNRLLKYEIEEMEFQQ